MTKNVYHVLGIMLRYDMKLRKVLRFRSAVGDSVDDFIKDIKNRWIM